MEIWDTKRKLAGHSIHNDKYGFIGPDGSSDLEQHRGGDFLASTSV